MNSVVLTVTIPLHKACGIICAPTRSWQMKETVLVDSPEEINKCLWWETDEVKLPRPRWEQTKQSPCRHIIDLKYFYLLRTNMQYIKNSVPPKKKTKKYQVQLVLLMRIRMYIIYQHYLPYTSFTISLFPCFLKNVWLLKIFDFPPREVFLL